MTKEPTVMNSETILPEIKRRTRKVISKYAYGWYNQIRPPSYNGYQTPFEARFG